MEAAWGCRPAAAAPLHVARQARAHAPLVRHASPAWHSCRVAACGAGQRLPSVPRWLAWPKGSPSEKKSRG
jgi:hypothetical protein